MDTEPRRIGKYELLQRLGHHSRGEVWKAYDTERQRIVVAKIFYADLPAESNAMAEFVHEMQVIASLHFSNVVQIYNVEVLPSSKLQGPSSMVSLVTEYIEGQTLADYIRRTPSTGKIPPHADLVHLFTSLSSAIDSAHERGIIHGNIKPTNILLSKQAALPNRIGEPKFTDFGLTRLVRNRSSITTPFYLSPEQIKGHAGDEQSDIYSLGVILYELCTGVLPFRGNRPIAIMMQHVNAPPTPPDLMNPTISPAVTNVILRSLTKDPAARFPNASSMTAALAQALSVPVPEKLHQFASLLDVSSTPVDRNHNAQQSVLPTYGTRPLYSPQLETSQSARLSSNAGSRNNGSDTGVSANALHLPIKASSQPLLSTKVADSIPPALSFPTESKGKKRYKEPFSILVLVLITLLLASALGTLLLVSQKSSVSTNLGTGHAFFENSGQLNANSNQGINDELQVDLSNIPNPSPGKSYYVWLLGDVNQTEAAPILLGRLTVNHGNVHFLYTGDKQHANLLGFISRFLITEEDVHNPSANPLLDESKWRYYAEIPQSPSPADKLHFSMLDHLRHLLVESPELRIRGLHGGLAIWLVKNTASISARANNAGDAWLRKDAQTIHDQIVRILDYLDGAAFVKTDVPSSTALLANSQDAQIGLLGPSPQNPDPPGYTYQNEAPPGYVYLIAEHMNGAILSPLTQPSQRQLAIQINTHIDDLRLLLERVRQDARQLMQLTDAQLLQPSSLTILDDLETQAQYAYAGQLNPSTGESQGGALWIYGNLQRLATFNVKTYIAPKQ